MPEATVDLNIFTLISQATLVVKLVMILLALMSIGSWAIIIQKAVSLSNTKKRALRDLESFQKARDLRSAIQALSRHSRSPSYQVALHGVEELNRLEQMENLSDDPTRIVLDTVSRSLEQGVNLEMGKMSSSVSFLATCANAAPFIGLFGTVYGIMNAFHSIGQMKTATLAVVAPGISEALVATALGLAVAIPATVAYNAIIGALRRLEADLVNLSGAFKNRVQRELPGHLALWNSRRETTVGANPN